MSDLPMTTLFLLTSLDGKISTGVGDERDFDKDLPRLNGVKEGLSQYYKLEEETDLFSLNTGRCMAKVGWNDEKESVDKLPVSFIIIDNKPHLTERGISNLLARTKKLYIVTTNDEHPAKTNPSADLEVIYYEDQIDFVDLFKKLKARGVDPITVQSGGTLNSQLIRDGLINFVSIVVAPILVGGKDTPTLIDGDSIQNSADLSKLRPLRLQSCDQLRDSYLHLRYEVINDFGIDS